MMLPISYSSSFCLTLSIAYSFATRLFTIYPAMASYYLNSTIPDLVGSARLIKSFSSSCVIFRFMFFRI